MSRLAPLTQAASLGALSGLATLGLAWSTQTTAPIIEAQKRHDFERLLVQVIPETLHENAIVDAVVEVAQPDGGPHRYYVGTLEGRVSCAAFKTVSDGYSGPIEMLVAVEPDGSILGVRVTSHTETPGLGDRIEAAKSDWIHEFDGKSLDNPPSERWLVTKDGGDFDALSGATITPRAVVRGIKEGLVRFASDQQQFTRRNAEQEAEP